MLYTLTAARDAVRTEEGKRVFWLYPGDRLTAAAEDWLREEGIAIRQRDASPTEFHDLRGGLYREKPEELTHLSGQLLVPKTHPRIAFRGALDSLEAMLLLCGSHCPRQNTALREMLRLCKDIMRADVLEEPLAERRLGDMDAAALRERSHYPQKYYGQGHFQPDFGDGEALLWLNRLRTEIRRTELLCCAAFSDRDGRLTRQDLGKALNRLSSYCYLLMIGEKARGKNG